MNTVNEYVVKLQQYKNSDATKERFWPYCVNLKDAVWQRGSISPIFCDALIMKEVMNEALKSITR